MRRVKERASAGGKNGFRQIHWQVFRKWFSRNNHTSMLFRNSVQWCGYLKTRNVIKSFFQKILKEPLVGRKSCNKVKSCQESVHKVFSQLWKNLLTSCGTDYTITVKEETWYFSSVTVMKERICSSCSSSRHKKAGKNKHQGAKNKQVQIFSTFGVAVVASNKWGNTFSNRPLQKVYLLQILKRTTRISRFPNIKILSLPSAKIHHALQSVRFNCAFQWK